MPWKVFKENDEFCVRKLDASGEPTGDAMGCHATEEEAMAQMRALYANAPEGDMPMKMKRGSENGIEYKATGPLMGQQVNERIVTGLAAVFGNIDDGDDRLWPGAFKKTIQENKARIRHLWNHELDTPPTAVIRDLREIGRGDLPPDMLSAFPDAKGGLQVTREYLDTPRGNEVLAGIKAGAINEMSFGFKAIRKDYEQSEGRRVRNLREVALLDTSDVPWGMNPASRAVKGALPFHENPTATKDAPWDGQAEVDKADVNDLKQMCAWVDPAMSEDKTGYKLPHHRADAGHTVVWRGVAAAMAAVLGSRGGVDIPEGDRRAVYEHLSKHYAQFDETPPDYKFYEFGHVIQDIDAWMKSPEFKQGRMISSMNMSKLKAAMDALHEIMMAAEPPDPEMMAQKALETRELFAELEQQQIAIEKLLIKRR